MSLATTGSLPSDFAKSNAERKTSSLVAMVRTTSTSCITGTGLKKCRPTTRSGRLVAAAMSTIVSELVLLAKIVSGPHSRSSSRKSSCFRSRSSVTASITMSASPRSASSVT